MRKMDRYTAEYLKKLWDAAWNFLDQTNAVVPVKLKSARIGELQEVDENSENGKKNNKNAEDDNKASNSAFGK